MKLTDIQRKLILVAIGLIYIILGVVQGVFKVKIEQNIINQIAFVLLAVALWLFFGKSNSARNQKQENNAPVEPLEDKDNTRP